MQIERIYKPDMRCQLQAIVLILRIVIPHHTVRNKKETIPKRGQSG